MITISEDNNEVYDLLEKAGQMYLDFSIDKVTGFDHEDNFYIVIYLSNSRNFVLFAAKDPVKNINTFPELINIIQEYSDTKIASALLERAVRITENKMHSKS